MSKSSYWSAYCKTIVSKSNALEDKENSYSIRNDKCVEGKRGVEKEKGSLLGAKNWRDPVDCTTSIQKSVVGKTQFQVYRDDNGENERSRSLMRRGAYKKEIRRLGGDHKSRNSTEALGTNEPTHTTIAVSRKTRSLSNQNGVSSNGNSKFSVKSSQRSRSENRDSSYAPITFYPPSLTISSKIKYLSNDVKKRTSCSIEMWKNKMRRSRSDLMSKNFSTVYSNVSRANRMRADPPNSDSFLKSSRSEVNLTSKNILTSETSNNQTTNVNQNINNKLDYFLPDIANKTLKPFISSVMLPQTATSLNWQCDIGARSHIRDKDRQFREKLNSNRATPSDNPLIQTLTSAKVRYCQSEMTSQSSPKKENFKYIDQILCESDYLIELPDTERKREENAPKLSSSFLRGDINAQQRRAIVGYLIYLGVHCNYESFITYQTVKLFDTAVDRIPVNTEQIQLMALTCLWIILKRELTNHKVPTATKILKLAKDVHKDQEKRLLITQEQQILSALNFNVRFADPYSLLMYYVSSLDEMTRYINQYDIIRTYFCGSYLIDISMLDENLCVISAFVLAITAFDLSLDFVLASNPNTDQTWRQSLRNTNTLAIWEEGQISFVKQIMMKLVLKSEKPDLRIVYKKYRHSKYYRISDFLLESVKKVTEEHKHDIE